MKRKIINHKSDEITMTKAMAMGIDFNEKFTITMRVKKRKRFFKAMMERFECNDEGCGCSGFSSIKIFHKN